MNRVQSLKLISLRTVDSFTFETRKKIPHRLEQFCAQRPTRDACSEDETEHPKSTNDLEKFT